MNFYPLFALSLVLSVSAATPRFDERVVFTAGREGSHTYRIPAIVRAVNGDLLAFAEGRVNNPRDHDDVDLVLKRSTDNGETWSALKIVWGKADGGVITWGNPCPVVDRTNGRVWLVCCWENYRVMVLSSDDHGATWSPPHDITTQVWNPAWTRPPEPTLAIWTGPGIGIQLERGTKAGRLVIPVQLRRHPLKGGEDNEAAAFYSDDHGANWHYSANTTGVGNEAQVIELADGRLALYQRNQAVGVNPRRRLVSFSSDGGATWTNSSPVDGLIGPAVQASVLRFARPGGGKDPEQGVMLLTAPAGPGRERLVVWASRDEGVSWSASRMVREGFSAYSCLIRQTDGRVGVLYEADNYRTIRYARFDVDWITASAGESEQSSPPVPSTR